MAIWVLRILMEIPTDIYAHYLGCRENTTSCILSSSIATIPGMAAPQYSQQNSTLSAFLWDLVAEPESDQGLYVHMLSHFSCIWLIRSILDKLCREWH